MGKIDKNALDRHITGNYGEDQLKDYEIWMCPRCERLEEVYTEEYIEIGTPMCTECGEPIEMEQQVYYKLKGGD
jgi:transcription elongation factor Elf1